MSVHHLKISNCSFALKTNLDFTTLCVSNVSLLLPIYLWNFPRNLQLCQVLFCFMWTTSLLLHQDFTQIFPSFWHIVLASLLTSTYSFDLKFVTFLDVPRKNSKVHHPNYINHSTIYFYRILEIINYIGADTEQDFIFS